MTDNFYIVDVFSESPYSGNPLAVIINTDALSNEVMQKIATEMNFSETTFVNPILERNNGYSVRIFTPAREIAFAGHPILGTAQILRNYLSSRTSSQINLNLSGGQITVTFEASDKCKEIIWFRAPPISLGTTATPRKLADILGISAEDIASNTPIQVASAGTSAIIVPIRSLDALECCKFNLEKFSTTLAPEGFPPLIYLFCQQTNQPENDLCVRFFFEANGPREDPATGNGASFLGAYLLEHQVFPETNLSLRIEQGHSVLRPSLILLRTRMHSGNPEIHVGGYVTTTVEGKLI